MNVARTALLIGVTLLAPVRASDAAAIDWARAETVSVVLEDDRFVPDKLTFRRGVPYRLHLENHGKELHEFTAASFFAAATVRDRKALASGGQDVVVQPGKTVDVFLLPRQAGTYRLICADHDWAGMIGEISVQ